MGGRFPSCAGMVEQGSAGRALPPLWLLIAISTPGPLALNILMPSMPGLVTAFSTDYGMVQLTLTLFLAGMAVSQIFAGTLADRFGRRRVVIGGLILFLTGSLLCLIAPTIHLLIFGRVIQALGGATGMVMARTILRDIHGLNRAAAMIGYVTMVMVIAPIAAPTLGGVLDSAVGFRGSFGFTAAVAVLLLLSSLPLLHETHAGPFQSQGVGPMFASFGILAGQWGFLRPALTISFSSAVFFSFLGGAPYVTITLMGRSSAEYGFYFAIVGLCYMAGNFLTGRLSERLGAQSLITGGTIITLGGGILLAGAYLIGLLNPITLFLGMSVVALGNGLCLPSGTAAAISADPARIGAASGLAGFLQMASGAIASFLVGALLDQTATPLIVAMTGFAIAAFVVNILGQGLGRKEGEIQS
ncbi:MAG: multidrug effflux MFS transporter [Magnetospiraceae bacterium]